MARRARVQVHQDERTAPRAITVAAPPVVSLDDTRARDADLVGAKAAALAVAMANGLPVLPGAVLTTIASNPSALRPAWDLLSDSGEVAVAVRSSSTVEDQAATSMAGHFTTVLDVATWTAAMDAVAAVRASGAGSPMAVLVQPMCDASVSGVLFGIDPVSGADHIVVEAVRGRPDELVSGRVAAARTVLSRRGRVLDRRGAQLLTRRDCRRLAALARDAQRVFGGAQDIEWAIDGAARLWLLQSRPVTAVATAARGPRLGPGPVTETFPEPLGPLEADLWLDPLRAAIRSALRITAAQPRRVLERSPVLVTVGGRVAADLDLLAPRRRRGLAALDPRPSARRLAAAWRVGRLRQALPLVAEDIVREIDRELARVPRVADLDDAQLLALLGRCRLSLRALHAHEVLAGALLRDDGGSAITLGLRAVARGRVAGVDDAAIAAQWPEALALVPPRVGTTLSFPAVQAPPVTEAPLGPREALRLRARWVQELSARAAAALGVRLAASGRLVDPLEVRWLTLDDVVAMVERGAPAPPSLLSRLGSDVGAPLPAVFRLTAEGAVVPEIPSDVAGQGAGGGRAIGPVASPDDDTPGTVLVVRTLEPGLAARLNGRAGLVAETGSVLSHLAIVARELGVPTVVGVPGAVERFPAGTTVLVDGRTGAVEVVT